MTTVWYKALGLAVLAYAATGCKSDTGQADEKQPMTAADSAKIVQVPPKPVMPLDTVGLKQTFNDWDAAMNAHDVQKLQKMFTEQVKMSGKTYTSKEAAAYKANQFKTNKGYKQEVKGDLGFARLTDSLVRVNFTREVMNKGQEDVRKSFLTLMKQNGVWKVDGEDDEPLGPGARNPKNRPLESYEVGDCEKAIEAVFRGSPMVKGMLDGPDASFKLESKPGDAGNTTGRYEYIIYLKPPHEKTPQVAGRFQLDPKSGDLFQVDPNRNTLMPSPPEMQYKQLFDKYCGGNK